MVSLRFLAPLAVAFGVAAGGAAFAGDIDYNAVDEATCERVSAKSFREDAGLPADDLDEQRASIPALLDEIESNARVYYTARGYSRQAMQDLSMSKALLSQIVYFHPCLYGEAVDQIDQRLKTDSVKNMAAAYYTMAETAAVMAIDSNAGFDAFHSAARRIFEYQPSGDNDGMFFYMVNNAILHTMEVRAGQMPPERLYEYREGLKAAQAEARGGPGYIRDAYLDFFARMSAGDEEAVSYLLGILLDESEEAAARVSVAQSLNNRFIRDDISHRPQLFEAYKWLIDNPVVMEAADEPASNHMLDALYGFSVMAAWPEYRARVLGGLTYEAVFGRAPDDALSVIESIFGDAPANWHVNDDLRLEAISVYEQVITDGDILSYEDYRLESMQNDLQEMADYAAYFTSEENREDYVREGGDPEKLAEVGRRAREVYNLVVFKVTHTYPKGEDGPAASTPPGP